MWAIIKTIDTFILRSTNDPYSSSSFDLILEQSDFQICPRTRRNAVERCGWKNKYRPSTKEEVRREETRERRREREKEKEKAARRWRRFIPRREVSYSLGKRGKDYRASRGTGSYLVVDGCRRWARSGWWMVVARASPSRCRSSRCALGACATFTWLHNPCTRARARGELGKWENHNLRLHHRLEPCVSVS